MPYDKIKWTGRKDRARLYEAHEVDFNYRGEYEVLKFPADMHVRVAKIMEVEFYPRHNRGIHDIPPSGYHSGISGRNLCKVYPVTMKQIEKEARNYIPQAKRAKDQKKGERKEDTRGGLWTKDLTLGITWVFDREQYVNHNEWYFFPHLAVRAREGLTEADKNRMTHKHFAQRAMKLYVHIYDEDGDGPYSALDEERQGEYDYDI